MDYLEKTLFPTLTENDIIIMDNMRTHHATAVTELAERLNIHILYLPPYSPDMNPIEKMWSKIKSILRKTKDGLLLVCLVNYLCCYKSLSLIPALS